ncbi:hypothetical protein GCM10022382_32270 [Microbacterium invictum]
MAAQRVRGRVALVPVSASSPDAASGGSSGVNGTRSVVSTRGHMNLVSDAVIAAIAIEHGATVVSFDRDFARFPALRWEVPSE